MLKTNSVQERLDSYIQGQKFTLKEFQNEISKNQSDVEFNCDLLDQLVLAVNQLDQNYEEFVEFLFCDMRWHSSFVVFDKLYDFTTKLLATHNFYLPLCTKMILRLFTVTKKEMEACDDIAVNDVTSSFCHNIIKFIGAHMPFYCQSIVSALCMNFPSVNRKIQIHEIYVTNMLKLTDYLPKYRKQVLEFVFERILRIDINFSRHELSISEENADKFAEDFSECDSAISLTGSSLSDKCQMKHEQADRLDVLLALFLRFIKRKCSMESGQADPQTSRTIFKNILFMVDKYLMNTPNSHHTQFIMFYICSCHPKFANAFMSYCWKSFVNSTSSLKRLISVYYLQSFLCRARFLTNETIHQYLQVMVSYAREYLAEAENSHPFPDINLHLHFYALCQSILSVLLFRFDSLTADGAKKVKKLKLHRIIDSTLRPLRFCLTQTVSDFSLLCRQNKWFHCDGDLFKQDSVKFVSKRSSVDNDFADERLKLYFPFEPCLLNRSSRFINPSYFNSGRKKRRASTDIMPQESLATDESSLKKRKKHRLIND